MRNLARKIVVSVAVGALLFSGVSTAGAATKAPTPGSVCKTAGQTVDTGSTLYTCVKQGKKLVWNKGVKYTTDPFKIGMITCKTGALAAYGDAYLEGWKSGLKWVSKGKTTPQGFPVVNNRPIQIIDTVDDKSTDTAAATAAFKDLVDKGAKVILGTCSSAIALALAPLAKQNNVLYFPGPAATDAISGVNKWTFRTGRQTEQDVATAVSFLGNTDGEKIIVMAEDYVFGQGNAAAVKALLAGKKTTVLDPVLVPLTATDLTPYAKRVKDAGADLVFVSFAALSPWTALKQQGVLSTSDIVTGLANYATWDIVGSVGGADFQFLSHYFGGAAGTNEEKAMLADLAAAGKRADLFNPDGFNAAMMVARAAKADFSGKDNTDTMIKALENYTFNSVKGKMTIRKQDHALIQPMFQARLLLNKGKYTQLLIKRVDNVAPILRDMQP
jgi:branched-chain amino acid transport system substrate-binding protein